MKKHVFVLSVVFATVIGMFLAGAQDSDPLVSLSYLNEVFAPSVKSDILQAVQEMLCGESEPLPQSVALNENITAGTVKAVTHGCVFVIKSGVGYCICPSGEGLIYDVTSGQTLSVGQSVPANHRLMAICDNVGIYAEGDVIIYYETN